MTSWAHPSLSSPRTSRWGSSQFLWSSLEHLLVSPHLEDGMHAVPIRAGSRQAGVYEFYLKQRKGAPVLVHFHGAVTRSEDDVPRVGGLAITQGIDATILVPSDPILDSNRALKIGWHAGARGARVHRIALAIVSHVASVAAAPRIVAWGGSGGGYAALRLARDHSNTTAFVWNPQTNIAQYSAPAVRAFERAGGYDSSACFADSSDMNLAKPDSWRWFLGSVIYFQESSDWHVEKHLMPVLEAMGSTETIEDLETAVISQPSRALTLVLSRWGDGHVPPPRDVIECVLRGLAGPAPNNLEVAESCRPMLLDARREVEST